MKAGYITPHWHGMRPIIHTANDRPRIPHGDARDDKREEYWPRALSFIEFRLRDYRADWRGSQFWLCIILDANACRVFDDAHLLRGASPSSWPISRSRVKSRYSQASRGCSPRGMVDRVSSRPPYHSIGPSEGDLMSMKTCGG